MGAAFARYCAAQGRPHVVLTRANYAEHVGQSCEVFINANGNSRKYLAREQPLAEFDASVRSARASLQDFRAGCYVHLSSCDVYPDTTSPAATREEAALDPGRQSPYGFLKHLAELCVRHAAPSWLILRLGGFVGPGLKKNPIFDILHGGPLWLDPASELQYLHTDAGARLIMGLVERGLRDEIVNVCGAGLIRLQDVIALVGRPVPVQPGSPRVRYDISIEKLSGYAAVPETRAAVLDFVRGQLAAAAGPGEAA